MMLLVFCLLLGFLWYLADKYYKEKFSPYLKWSSALFILILLSFELFAFIEMGRLVDLKSYNSSSCLMYSDISTSFPINFSIENAGLESGDIQSLYYVDGNRLIISPNGGVRPAIYANYTVNSLSGISYNMNMGAVDWAVFYLQGWNGITWNTIHSANVTQDPVTYDLLNVSQYEINGLVRLRIIRDMVLFSNDTTFIEFDKVTSENTITTSAYCQTSSDTAFLMTYHYAEYWVYEEYIGILPYLAMFIGVALAAWLMNMSYQSFKQGREVEKKP